MFKLIEHTADMGIEAEAETLPEVFIEMAQGLIVLMCSCHAAGGSVHKKIAVQADDLAELIVNWLNEIVYLYEVGGFVPSGIIIEQISETYLQASLNGQYFDPQVDIVERQVKAVTYHQAVVEKKEQAWFARVYVDL